MMIAASPLITLLLAITPLAQATPAGEDAAIPPVVWELVELAQTDAAALSISEPERYTVQFLPDGEIAVRADCNQASGISTAADGTLDITLTVFTLALCPPDSQEAVFQELLDSATEYAFESDGALTLSGEDGHVKFRASLLGVIWEWQEFSGMDDSVIAPENPEQYTLTFLPDGEIAVQADCNRATGTYAADGDQLDLSLSGATEALCPPGSLSERFLRDLDDTSSHVFRDGNLYLALPVDAGIMEFVARYIEPPPATPVAASA